MEELGIHEFPRYLELLKRAPEEVAVLRSLLHVTITRFYRNRRVFDVLSGRVLPELAARGIPVRAWSAGCASGEEAYSVRIAWEELPGGKPPLVLLATDIDPVSLARASEGIYGESSLREMPRDLREKYFSREGGAFRIREDVKAGAEFRRHDLLSGIPPGKFDLILCRNAVFTYFGADSRVAAARAFSSALFPGGWLVLGRTEKLPPEAGPYFQPAYPAEKIYRLREEGESVEEAAG
jgi:chemotaxis protein methyltransferase CheR